MINTIIKKINSQIVSQDKLRKSLILKQDTLGFKKTYSKTYDILNSNTSNYWDTIFSETGNLSQQSAMTRDKIAVIAKSIPLMPHSLLDLGIGQGFLEEALSKRLISYKLKGVDISPNAIKRAKNLFKGGFVLENVLKINKLYKKNSFEIVVALELLEHISPSKLFTLYTDIYNILKDNGMFIISIPINEHLELMPTNPSAHVRDYSFEIIKTELELSGFRIEKKYFLFAFNKFYIFKKLLSKMLPKKWSPNSLIIVARKK